MGLVACFGGEDLFPCFLLSISFFFERTRPAVSMRRSCLIYLSTSNGPRERSDRIHFCHRKSRELYEADFHKPGICGSGCVWANAWDVFRRAPSRGGRGRRADVDIVGCIGRGGLFVVFCFFRFFFFERTRPTSSMRPTCLIYIFTSNEVVFCL